MLLFVRMYGKQQKLLLYMKSEIKKGGIIPPFSHKTSVTARAEIEILSLTTNVSLT